MSPWGTTSSWPFVCCFFPPQRAADPPDRRADGTITCSCNLRENTGLQNLSFCHRRHPDNNLQSQPTVFNKITVPVKTGASSILYGWYHISGSQPIYKCQESLILSVDEICPLSLPCTYCIRKCIFEWFSKISLLGYLIGIKQDVNLEVEAERSRPT